MDSGDVRRAAAAPTRVFAGNSLTGMGSEDGRHCRIPTRQDDSRMAVKRPLDSQRGTVYKAAVEIMEMAK